MLCQFFPCDLARVPSLLLPPLRMLAFEHEQSLCTEDLPGLECVLQGWGGGEEGGLWGTAAVFGGRPACLQLCFLRPCESSRPGPARSEPEELTALSTFATCQSPRQTDRQTDSGAAVERRSERSVQPRKARRSRCLFFFLYFFNPRILFLWLPFTHSSGKKAPLRFVCLFKRSEKESINKARS